MLEKLKVASAILKNMGWRYTQFRVKHELMRRSGLLKNRFPVTPGFKQFIPLDEWKKTRGNFFFRNKEFMSSDLFNYQFKPQNDSPFLTL